MSEVLMARTLFGVTLGYHITYATLGVGIPFLIFMAEVMFWRTKDPSYRLFAKRLTRVAILLVGVGIVTGTTVAVMLSVLWPKFMQVVGEIINLPFEFEVFAFIMESLFLAIYVYGGERLSQKARIFSSLFVAIGAGLSALLVTDVNAFMNTPAGLDWVDGRVLHANPWAAMINPSMPTELGHVLASAYMAVAFVFAAAAARGLLKKQATAFERAYHKKNLTLTMSIGGIAAVCTAFIGDAAGKMMATYQPEKLAAAEGLFHTTKYAPLVIGGIVQASKQRIVGGIPIPGLLSWLATTHLNATVIGLDAFPRWTWPALAPVHLMFDTMVGIGTFAIGVAFVYFLIRWKVVPRLHDRWLLWVIVLTGFLSMVAIEDGWVFAEEARQPWIIYGMMTVDQAVTTAPGIGWMFGGFMLLFTVLLIGTVLSLRSYFTHHPLTTDELVVQTGPTPPVQPDVTVPR
ncbi:MAG: cytochrome ubiquinol oxidase subunit I [Firmicutes bacterium]|nr:cytochrome ubiquinol oxidase subunit I [Bacillota bacterium]